MGGPGEIAKPTNIVVGVAGALYGSSPTTRLLCSRALLTIAAIGLIAVWQLVWRAVNVEPAIILREE